MDLLKKEMERKRKALQEAKAKSKQRFLKVSDIRNAEEEESASSTSKRPSSSEELSSDTKSIRTKRRRGENDSQTESSGQLQQKGKDQTTSSSSLSRLTTPREDEDLSVKEVIQALRAFGLPVRLFGEKAEAQRERLEQARQSQKETLASLSEKEEFRLGKGHSIRNPFLEKDETTTVNNAVNETSNKLSNNETKESEKWNAAEEKDPHKKIYRYFKGLLREWEGDLVVRPEEVKRSVAGRNETKTLKQCKDYIRPLFKLCKNRNLEEGMMNNILRIVDFCIQGEFVRANDAYIDVAIGRAAWPIGVTMVGIHERTGRSKINSQNVAHVMNSELQRKYLTSVKRLMTFTQRKRTDIDPSKKVMN